MALVLADRVRETTSVTGTGTATLLGAVLGNQSFAIVGNANTTYYCIAGQGTSEWEVGIGTYSTTGPTLARTTVLSSSNAGALVSFSAGTKDVFVTYPSEAVVAISNDVATATFVYPLFAAAVSGTPTTLYTSNAKYLYNPSTGELQAPTVNATNGIHINSQTMTTSQTIAAGSGGVSVGPFSIATGAVLTIASGARHVII